MKPVVLIENGTLLRRALRRAEVDLKDLSASNRKAARVVAERARSTSPIGDAKKGHIKNTIRPGGTTRMGVIRVGNTSMPYAGVLHYGTPAGNTTVRGHRAPNPWVIKAAHDTEPSWLNIYYKELKEIIERIG
ncbi:hypothetical protein E4U03_07800 [Rothia nasimurium]|uniref:HK97 gp10 family phage protein n=1 Tax=Rothia nasimurium TaxID=85336 RepID=A0A4Y9F591_9MICC|nr:hypothetical protein [Rothia nasimurium]MBF0808511.1 hypothetical protein [Rothia nasimurium]TFU21905.1 hypothetical protein E4U03_07800 [Rothia nasimurium]